MQMRGGSTVRLPPLRSSSRLSMLGLARCGLGDHPLELAALLVRLVRRRCLEDGAAKNHSLGAVHEDSLRRSWLFESTVADLSFYN
jgi:hypothetical protein